MEPKDAVKCLVGVETLWRDTLPKTTIKAWASLLVPYEAVDVTQGLITLAKTSRFAPALAEIIEAAEQERLLREAREYEEALARHRAEQAALPEPTYEIKFHVETPPKTESLKRIREYMRRVGRPMPTR